MFYRQSWLRRSLGKVPKVEGAAAPEGTDRLTELVAAPRVEDLLVVSGEVGSPEPLAQAVLLGLQHQHLTQSLSSRQ